MEAGERDRQERLDRVLLAIGHLVADVDLRRAAHLERNDEGDIGEIDVAVMTRFDGDEAVALAGIPVRLAAEVARTRDRAAAAFGDRGSDVPVLRRARRRREGEDQERGSKK